MSVCWPCVRVRACVVGWSEARVLGGADACAAQMLGVYLVSGVMVLISIVMALVSAGSHARSNGHRSSKTADRAAAGAQQPVAEQAAPESPLPVSALVQTTSPPTGLESLRSEMRELRELLQQNVLHEQLHGRRERERLLPQAKQAPKQAGEGANNNDEIMASHTLSPHALNMSSPRMSSILHPSPRHAPAARPSTFLLDLLRSKQDTPVHTPTPTVQSAGTLNGWPETPDLQQPAPFTTKLVSPRAVFISQQHPRHWV